MTELRVLSRNELKDAINNGHRLLYSDDGLVRRSELEEKIKMPYKPQIQINGYPPRFVEDLAAMYDSDEVCLDWNGLGIYVFATGDIVLVKTYRATFLRSPEYEQLREYKLQNQR